MYEKFLASKSILSLSLSLMLILLATETLAYHGIPITIIGTTAPDALVTARIPKLEFSQAKLADEEGHFIFTFNDVPRGVYLLRVSAMKNGSVNETAQLLGVPESEAVTQMTLSEIALPLERVKPIKKEKADLNDDGRVDLVDLSVLLFYWSSPIRSQPVNPDADLNGDGAVNLKDVALLISRLTF